MGAGGYRAREFPRMLAAVATTGAAPVIDSVWPFAKITDALATMAAGTYFGKIVVSFEV